MKNITILGSTGSIGCSALRVVKSFSGEFKVHALACGSNISLLREQINEFGPSFAAVQSERALVSDEYKKLKKDYPSVRFFEGDDGVVELASQRTDTVVSAIVGAAGLRPGMAAIESSKRIALANKETLVVAGDIFMKRVRERGVELLPVDSEHSAIFSLLENKNRDELLRIIITASGGSLRDLQADELAGVTPERALKHPTWNMGQKITIDSATLMNKGLEVMEAHHLFGVDYDKIDVIVHPESVIHSMIETVDGSIYAHMGVADMALPVLSALKYPEKCANEFGRLDLAKIGSLNFRPVDHARYPALDLCYDAGKKRGNMPAILNASNEIAVNAFLEKRIGFTDIVKVVENTMKSVAFNPEPSFEELLGADHEARDYADSYIKGDNKW